MRLSGLQRRLRRGSGHAGWAWLLALVLLQAQWLGQWHGVAHAGGHATPAQSAGHHPHDDHAAFGHAAFGHAADDEAQCRLYDAVGSAASPCAVPFQALVQGVAAAPRADVPAPRDGRPDRPYEARAPPQG